MNLGDCPVTMRNYLLLFRTDRPGHFGGVPDGRFAAQPANWVPAQTGVAKRELHRAFFGGQVANDLMFILQYKSSGWFSGIWLSALYAKFTVKTTTCSVSTGACSVSLIATFLPLLVSG